MKISGLFPLRCAAACTCLLAFAHTSLAWAQGAIPFKREAAAGSGDWSRLGLGMLISLAVLGLVLYWLRRYLRQAAGRPVTGSSLEMGESRRLGPRASLHVVHFANQQYLIGQSEQGLVVLASSPLLANPDAPAATPAATPPTAGARAQPGQTGVLDE